MKQTLAQFEASLLLTKTLNFSVDTASWCIGVSVVIDQDEGDVIQFIQDVEGNPRTMCTGYEFIAQAFHGIQQMGIEFRMFGKRIDPVHFDDTSGDTRKISLGTEIMVRDLGDYNTFWRTTLHEFFVKHFPG